MPKRSMVLKPSRPSVREEFRLLSEEPALPTPARTAPAGIDQVHLLIRYATSADGVDEVLAALTDHHQAVALLETYERLEASGSGYDVVALPVHTSAAAVLGL